MFFLISVRNHRILEYEASNSGGFLLGDFFQKTLWMPNYPKSLKPTVFNQIPRSFSINSFKNLKRGDLCHVSKE